MSILVLGLGNILLQDEGVGVRAVEALEERWILPDGVAVVDGGTAGMDMLDVLAGYRHMLVADAVKTGAPPGSTVVLKGEEVPAFFRGKLSPHQVGLSDLLATLALQDEAPETVTLVGCVPFAMKTSLDMTPEMAARVPVLVDLLVTELRALGADPVPRGAK